MGKSSGGSLIVGAIVVIEGRDGEDDVGIECVHPGEIEDGVGFLLRVAEAQDLPLADNKIPCLPEPAARPFSKILFYAGADQFLVAEACNHPNCLVVPFSAELIHRAA
jgi:hypothetical protein